MKLEELQTIISKKIADEITVDFIKIFDYTAEHENHVTFEGNFHFEKYLLLCNCTCI